MDNIQGNVSTIAVAIYALLAPYIAQYVSEDVFLAIVGLILVLWSAYNPNSFAILGNSTKTEKPVGEEDLILNDEYTTGDDDGS